MEFTMSKTNLQSVAFCRLRTSAVVAGLALAFCTLASAQMPAPADVTINDLANAQKAKLKDEIAKAQGLPTQQDRVAAVAQAQAQSAAAVRDVKTRSAPAIVTSVTVYGAYTLSSGSRVVELTDGRNLFLAKTGSRYGKWVISEVTDASVKITLASCKTKCGAGRTVAIGGAF